MRIEKYYISRIKLAKYLASINFILAITGTALISVVIFLIVLGFVPEGAPLRKIKIQIPLEADTLASVLIWLIIILCIVGITALIIAIIYGAVNYVIEKGTVPMEIAQKFVKGDESRLAEFFTDILNTTTDTETKRYAAKIIVKLQDAKPDDTAGFINDYKKLLSDKNSELRSEVFQSLHKRSLLTKELRVIKYIADLQYPPTNRKTVLTKHPAETRFEGSDKTWDKSPGEYVIREEYTTEEVVSEVDKTAVENIKQLLLCELDITDPDSLDVIFIVISEITEILKNCNDSVRTPALEVLERAKLCISPLNDQ
jgi:hypothetical protein